jgi:DNA polymerase II small subunit
MNYNISEEKREILNKILSKVSKPVSKIEIEKEKENSNIIVLSSYEDDLKERKVEDFVAHYVVRFEKLKKILHNRPELQDVTSINRILFKRGREEVSLIGIVTNKRITKNGNVLLGIEDRTGSINVLISKNKSIFKDAKDVVLDEVIGVKGVLGDKIVFVNSLLFPGMPSKELKKCDDDVYAVFTADLHVGSDMFLEKDVLKFVDWLNGKLGNQEQKEIASKVKYLFVVGDLTDGVGIYPEQDKELDIKEITMQYDKVAEILDKIRKDIKIIVCGGNHDALRLAEPQPKLSKEFATKIYEMENVTITTNPSMINIHSSKDFEGFNVLMYHG